MTEGSGMEPGSRSTTPLRQPRDLTGRTLSGLLWIGGGKVVYAGLRLLVLVILARLLSPAEFGVVGAALVVVGFSAIFSQLGLAPAIVQRPVLERRHLEAAFTASVLLGLLLGVTLWVTAPLAAEFFRIPGVAPVLRVLAWIFPLEGLSAIAESQVQRELRFRWLATMEVLTFGVGYGVVGVVLGLLGAGVWALVVAQMAQTTLYTTILLVTYPPALRLVPDRAALAELMYYGGGFTASKIANYFALQADNLVVGRWLGATALGFYGRAYELMAAPPHLLGDAVDRVLFPAMASIQTDIRKLADAYQRGVGLMALIMLPASVTLFIVAPELIDVTLGPQWTVVVTPFQILALGMFLRTSYRISDVTARATAAVYRRAWRQLVYALCVLVGAWFGKAWGINGVAVGVLIALAVNFFLMAHLGLRLTSLSWRSFGRAHAPALALAAVAGGLAWATAAGTRALGTPDLVALVATLGVTVCGVVLAARTAPQLVFGPHGRWFVDALRALVREPPRARPAATSVAVLPLLDELAATLRTHGIPYCQWKGHGKRDRWGQGDGDIDLLVDRAHADGFAAVLAELGFKQADSRVSPHRPDERHYFGLDEAGDKLVHLHVMYRLVVGRPWETTYTLPLEHAVLASRVENGGFTRPGAELELVILVIHNVARVSLRDAVVPQLPQWLAAIQPELDRLEGQVNRDRLSVILQRHLPSVDLPFFERCLAALRPNTAPWRRLLVKRALHRRLRAYAARPPLRMWLVTWRRRLATLGGLRGDTASRKHFHSGTILALVGGDGAGKTTCATALHAWLARHFETYRAHLGRPPKGLMTASVGVALRVAGVFDRRGTGALMAYLELLYHLATARDRYRLYLKVRRFTANKGLAICERYPVSGNHSLVGPRIKELVDTVPYAGLARWLARAEQRYYERFGREDILIVLQVDPETAVRRKTSEPAEYVRNRVRIVMERDWSSSGARVVDAARPLPEVLHDLKALVWSEL